MDPFDAPADDVAADDMFDMPVGDGDDVVRGLSRFFFCLCETTIPIPPQTGDDFGDDLGLGGEDVVEEFEEEKEAKQEEEQKEEKVDNTPKSSEALLKFQSEWRNRCIEMDKLAGEKKKELQSKAKEALQTFSEQRESHKSKRKSTNRENEKDFMEQIQSEK